MTGNLPREAITFGVDDLFYAASLRVVRAAETGRSGSSWVRGGKIHISRCSYFQCTGVLALSPHHHGKPLPQAVASSLRASRHEEERW